MIEKLSVKRSQQKFFLYSGVVLWLVAINVWLFCTYHSRSRSSYGNDTASDHLSIYDEFGLDYKLGSKSQSGSGSGSGSGSESDPNSENKSFKDDITIKILQKHQSKEKDIRGVDAHASIYDKIFANHDIDSIFGNLNFEQRCDLFFQNLFMHDNNWILKVNERNRLENKNEFKFNDFKRVHLEEYKKEFASANHKNHEDVENTPEFEQFVRTKYDEFWKKTMKYEQKIVDQISIMRVFNKCYITSDNTTQVKRTNEFVNDQHKLMTSLHWASSKKSKVPSFKFTKEENRIHFKSIKHSALEHRVYPWLSFEYPIYERFTSKVSYHPPIMSKYLPDQEEQRTTKPTKHSNELGFFLNKFKNQCNGRGIVLTIGDSHVEDTVKLIHLLRALNNKLPIQIVYYQDISKETKTKIVTAARESIGAFPKSFEKVKEYFPDDYLSNDGGLPKQEVWFVNTYNVIHEDFKDRFKGYANKFLATFFNSFDEFMLIDADTVMMQNPDHFFNLPGYKENGAFFYKDRTTFETRPKSDIVFFKKLGPSIVDSVMFDIPIMTKHTVENDFMRGLYHYQESGLVMLNRKIHFNAILLMFQLNFNEPVNGRIHGDKEIFWLALAINGNENYAFNENYAAAIGKVTPQTERTKPDGTPHQSVELCSPHPGHISDQDNALEWINSGFFYCSKSPIVDFKKEAEQKARLKSLKSAEDFKAFYYSPLRISSAVIPPLDLNVWAVNVEDEPSRGWFMDSRYCKGYMWCAYTSIGGLKSDGESNRKEGRLIHFTEKEEALFAYYGDIWVGLE
ncbi:hypothetical protein KGF56_004249 [Candida oxycetoniae]|uniref:Alpha-1,3-mannosyltransferase n=1 Tax=Candida oxycetoniae TaxID=497107 RepID=A0AAI9SU94_9ASCO|nr:uncharacterized protein KGF56_004249 [Candida oxycetoniae]KAI3402996.2 hypothetical protein KGF56_004249 [Candida oxycetoniae]